jgi:hypothetical protein
MGIFGEKVKCNDCRRQLSTEKALNSELVGAIIARKGWKCRSCGKFYCTECAMKKSMKCNCGQTVMPILD